MGFASFWYVFTRAGLWMGNLTAVYFLEYSIQTVFLDVYTTKMANYKMKGNYFEKNSFAMFKLFYQIGVMIS